MLYNETEAMYVLGAVLKEPELILSNKYNLTKEDFKPSKFHSILFSIINNLSIKGIRDIEPIDIGNLCSPHKAQMEVLEDNNYIDFVETIKSIAKEKNFIYYYNNLRKFTVLRYYKNEGFPIEKIYDETLDDDSQMEKLNGLSVEDIITYFGDIQSKIKKEFVGNGTQEEIQAGVGFEETKERFKETPYYGANLQSLYQTSLYRGWCRGHLILRSAPSGFGKTILGVADLCMVCAKEYWDIEKEKWVVNKNRQGAGLFINTEMDLMTELTPMFIAWIANVSRSDIADGVYHIGEEERVDYAIKVLQESEIYLVDDPKFTISSLESTLRDYAENKNILYAIMDYLQDNGIVGKEMKKTHEIVARDTIILNLAENLKVIARELNIGIMTSTQLNGNEKTADIIDEACLSGGKAIKNKIDAGCIIMFPRKKELQLTENFGVKRGFHGMKPNIVSHSFKIRFGKYGTNIKIFQYADLGTGRITDLYVVNVFNEPINVEIPIFEEDL